MLWLSELLNLWMNSKQLTKETQIIKSKVQTNYILCRMNNKGWDEV